MGVDCLQCRMCDRGRGASSNCNFDIIAVTACGRVRGRGFATEAAAACRAHARDRLGVDRLVAIIHPDNTPSKRVAERIGLSFERATTSESGDPAHVYAARLA